MRTTILRLTVILLLIAARSALADAPLIHTSNGTARGSSDSGINAFRALPYAAPPVGSLRWRPPQPPAPWSGVRDARRFGPICPQDLRSALPDTSQSEDCLTLSVFAPAHVPKGGLPVMVWIHGGSFRWGAGSLPAYDGIGFAQQGVVLVTLNYRLDRLGRFGHPALSRAQAGEGLANYGLMDQVAALAWVRDNIAGVGGDPARVTIFGFSAGGVSVNYLMAVPAAKGLFQRAISESGGISVDGTQRLSGPVGRFKSLEQDGLDFAASFGIANDEQAPEKLRALSTAQILAYPQKDSSMNPVVDGRFVPEDIGRVFREGRQHSVAYLTGANSWEGSLIRPFNLPLPAVLLGVTPEQARKVYGPLDDITLKESYIGDLLFLAPAWTLAADMANANARAWLYHFSYVDDQSRGKVPGAAHGAEVSLIFRRPSRAGATLSEHDIAVGAPMRRYWLQFARTGDPNDPALPHWPTFSRANPAVMEFGEVPTVHAALFSERMEFHQQLIEAAVKRMQ